MPQRGMSRRGFLRSAGVIDSPSVGPAPSPVDIRMTAGGGGPTPDEVCTQSMRTARPAPGEFERHLPHYEGRGSPLYITFSTKDRKLLPEAARWLVLKHVLHDHMKKMELVCVVVMPDHVHMLYCPWDDDNGNRYTKTEIVGAIKSASAHSVNKLLGRKGPLWQDEFFDHVLRNDENIEQKAHYIIENPVRKGLCTAPDDYPYLWRAWIEGVRPETVGPESVGPAPSPVKKRVVPEKEMTAGGGGPTPEGA